MKIVVRMTKLVEIFLILSFRFRNMINSNGMLKKHWSTMPTNCHSKAFMKMPVKPVGNCDVLFQYVVSGLKVSRLDMYGEKYKPFKGVKYVTKAGRFQVRM